MRGRTDLLGSAGFTGAVVLLLLNDFVLKAELGNALTGKLSDFAGLFAFTLFWVALFPRRRGAVCLAVAVAFAAWKSPAAQPLIDGWNGWAPFRIGRVVDATDLIALAAVVAANRYDPAPFNGARAVRWAMVPVSLFSFAATSRVRFYTYDEQQYLFPFSEPELAARIDALRMGPYIRRGDAVEVWMADEGCTDDMRVGIRVQDTPGGTRVDLVAIDKAYACANASGKGDVLRVFERCFVARLEGTPLRGRGLGPTPAPGSCRAGATRAGKEWEGPK